MVCVPVYAVSKYTIYPMTDLELSMLPPFCVVWGKGDEAATDRWVKKIKVSNIHHLCKGLNHLNHTIIDFNPDVVAFNAKQGVTELDYVLAHNDEKAFPLKAYVLVSRARLNDALGKQDEATSDFINAIKENPKYENAYYWLAETYLRHNEKYKAIEVINQGLDYIPGAKLLKKLKLKL